MSLILPSLARPRKLGAEHRRRDAAGAVELAAFEREQPLGRAGIAGDHLEFHAEQLAIDHRKRIRLRADPRRAGDDFVLVEVVDAVDPARRRHDAGVVVAVHIADPRELAAVELDAGRLVDLLLNDGAAHHAEKRTVLRRGVEDHVGERHAARRRHVLHDDRGIARNVFGDVAAKRANVDVVAAARAVRRAQRQLVTLVEALGVLRGRCRRAERDDQRRPKQAAAEAKNSARTMDHACHPEICPLPAHA